MDPSKEMIEAGARALASDFGFKPENVRELDGWKGRAEAVLTAALAAAPVNEVATSSECANNEGDSLHVTTRGEGGEFDLMAAHQEARKRYGTGRRAVDQRVGFEAGAEWQAALAATASAGKLLQNDLSSSAPASAEPRVSLYNEDGSPRSNDEIREHAARINAASADLSAVEPRPDVMTAEEAIALVMKRPEMYGLKKAKPECSECGGNGKGPHGWECHQCQGTGKITVPAEPSDLIERPNGMNGASESVLAEPSEDERESLSLIIAKLREANYPHGLNTVSDDAIAHAVIANGFLLAPASRDAELIAEAKEHLARVYKTGFAPRGTSLIERLVAELEGQK